MLYYIKNIKKAISLFFKLKMMRSAAAIAYYTLFSLPPILMVVIFLAQQFYGAENPDDFMISEMSKFEGAENARNLIQSLSKLKIHATSSWNYIIGILLLIVSATSVFSALKAAFHKIFDIKYNHNLKQSIVKQLKNRLLSIGFIVGTGLILSVSLLMNLALHYIDDGITSSIFGMAVNVVLFYDLLSHLLVISGFFMLMFWLLIDVAFPFKKLLSAALFTSLLFIAGKSLLSGYISANKALDVYSGAGGAIVLLLWIYYSSGIILLGGAYLKVISLKTTEKSIKN